MSSSLTKPLLACIKAYRLRWCKWSTLAVFPTAKEPGVDYSLINPVYVWGIRYSPCNLLCSVLNNNVHVSAHFTVYATPYISDFSYNRKSIEVANEFMTGENTPFPDTPVKKDAILTELVTPSSHEQAVIEVSCCNLRLNVLWHKLLEKKPVQGSDSIARCVVWVVVHVHVGIHKKAAKMVIFCHYSLVCFIAWLWTQT